MVERLTDYTRRIWTALAADAPEDHDIQVNDVIYYMDSSRCGIVTQVYPGGSIDVEFLPDVGGGGGGSTIVSKSITANGTYYASADSADGYNPVTVNVSAPPPPMENLVFKLNNQIGVAMNFFSAFYDSDRSFITLYIYAAQSNNTSVQKTCLIQNGTVQLGMANNRTITSITYNGNPVPFTQSGSGQRRYVEFTVPDNFDPNIDIIFT